MMNSRFSFAGRRPSSQAKGGFARRLLLGSLKMLKRMLMISVTSLAVWHGASAVDLNAASLAELESARGLGPSKAALILKEREAKGPFRSWDDLHARVPGIGEKTMEQMRASGLTLAPPAEPSRPAPSAS
ncbi:ComEA family DNA-binding protein [Derxia lacustris]|uniref:ComEA family DNA-binding protein n=1 Tax=Derxia lacustris TaxID=764842 RepID=UPI000A16F0CE|nr:ComEA family DNA-binding protein [Derxia lacustris]